MNKINYSIRLLLVKAYLFLLPFTINSAPIFSGIKGIVHDSETDDPLENAVVKILELDKYDATDSKGEFVFENIPIGKYSIEISFIGYKTEIIKIDLSTSGNTNIIVHLTSLPIQTKPIIVTAEQTISEIRDLTEFSSILKGKELQKDMGITLASTLKNEVGLSIRSMGPAPSRPVIRGLSGDRVLINEDNNKTNDLSATSPDHAVTIEPFTIDKIEVIRGPKVLMFTTSTIGGIINIVRDEIPNTMINKISGNAGIYGESANNGYLGSLTALIPFSPLVFRFEISGRKADDIRTPKGILENTQVNNLNFGIGGSYINDLGFIGVSLREYHSEYGIPGGFVGAHPNGVNIEMFRRNISALARLKISKVKQESIDIKFHKTYYKHTELESNGNIGAEFRIDTYSGSVELNHDDFFLFSDGEAGISYEHRDLRMGGFVFTPHTKSGSFSLFFYENINRENLFFSFGGRFNRIVFNPEKDNEYTKIGLLRDRDFNIFSFSFSGAYSFTENTLAGINISRSSRAPTIEELYSEGPHLASYSYEIGNPDLDEERGFGSELFLRYKRDKFQFILNGFYNHLDYYIIPVNTGRINFQKLLPIYQTFGEESALYGLESELSFAYSDFEITSTLTYTEGIFIEEKRPLPGIPPLKLNVDLSYNINDFIFGVSSEVAASQKRTDQFEFPTAGYAIFNFSSTYTLHWMDLVTNITLNIDNIFDKEYYNHLSRVKVIMPEAGRNLRIVARTFF